MILKFLYIRITCISGIKFHLEDLAKLLEPKKFNETSIEYPIQVKKILENLGTPHKVENNTIVLESQEAKIFFNLLFREKPIIADLSVPKILTKSSGIQINNKFSTSIGVRIGRPEKAAPRQMKPATHVLFPIGEKGGPTRDLLKASRTEHFFANLYNRHCITCNQPSIGIKCSICGTKTSINFRCSKLQGCS